MTERGDLLQWWRYMHSNPGLRGLHRARCAHSCACLDFRPQPTGFRAVLQDGRRQAPCNFPDHTAEPFAGEFGLATLATSQGMASGRGFAASRGFALRACPEEIERDRPVQGSTWRSREALRAGLVGTRAASALREQGHRTAQPKHTRTQALFEQLATQRRADPQATYCSSAAASRLQIKGTITGKAR